MVSSLRAGITTCSPVVLEESGETGGAGRAGGSGAGGTTRTFQVESAKNTEKAPVVSVCVATLGTRSAIDGEAAVRTTPASLTESTPPSSSLRTTVPDADRSGRSWKSTTGETRRSMALRCTDPSCSLAGARTSASTRASCEELARHSPRKQTESLEHCELELQTIPAPFRRGSRSAQATTTPVARASEAAARTLMDSSSPVPARAAEGSRCSSGVS